MLWFGTWGGGISRYDGKKFANFIIEEIEEEEGLKNNQIFAIHCDSHGVLWFGTWRGGVYRYDGRELVNFTTKDGLANNLVPSIHSDADGVLWFGTDGGGVSGYDGVAWTSLDTRDELSGNCVVVQEDINGCLWFGTEGGLTRYRRSRTSPKARIVAVTTDRRYTDLDSLEPITAGTRITFEYSSIDFKTHPDKRLYRYQGDDFSSRRKTSIRRAAADVTKLSTCGFAAVPGT